MAFQKGFSGVPGLQLPAQRSRHCPTAAGNSIGDDGAMALAAVLVANTTVQHVDLHGVWPQLCI